MSIIEKALRKLNGSGGRQSRPHHEATPKAVVQPTVARIPSEPAMAPTTSSAGTTITQELRARAVPQAQLQARALLASAEATPQIMEEFRRIKRPLLANAFGKGATRVERGNLIIVTSSMPGEGKSRTALNLAHSIALERDHTVLLVDADIANAQITRMYGLGKAPGLTDVLLDGKTDLQQVTVRTDLSQLAIVPAGRRSDYATELLSSNQMAGLLARLVERYPDLVVVFDCPPLLVTNEPQALARLVGQIVLVVEAGRTPQHMVKEALASLDQSKAIGLVLNKSQYSFGGDYYYGYYYGGGYGYGSEVASPHAKDQPTTN
jgi:protein-tyrosine kinase